MSTTRSVLVVLLAGAAMSPVAEAQPGPASAPNKGDAKALLLSGNKLMAARDYLGALAVYKDAYSRFPSDKILINIGLALARLDRHAEAANTLQRYLDSPDADPAKRPSVRKEIADLDRKVGIVEVTTTPADAEVQVGGEDWLPVTAVARYRVPTTELVVRARRATYQASEQTVRVAAGETAAITLVLVPEPTAPAPVETEPRSAEIERALPLTATRSRFGLVVLAHIDPANAGGAARVGVTADLTPRLQVQGAALLGPSSGGYLGASVALLEGRVRPLLVAGLPLFISNGARFALRGGAGIELAINRRFAVIAELGLEYLVNPEAGVSSTLVIPAIGASGRL